VSDDTCEFCNRGNKTLSSAPCGAKSRYTGYRCTRREEHAGSHVACGGPGNHSLRIWDNEKDDANKDINNVCS
jgi:hypothetical protein